MKSSKTTAHRPHPHSNPSNPPNPPNPWSKAPSRASAHAPTHGPKVQPNAHPAAPALLAPQAAAEPVSTLTFEELNLLPAISKAIQDLGYTKPSPIQAQTLPILLAEPTDFLGLAATGTGKTAAFSIPLLQKVNPSKRAVQAIILCPTRELAVQVAGQIDLLGKHLGIRALPIYGGAPYGDQIRGLRNGATIVVGTPGRVVDHIDKGTLDLSKIETVVLDEADEMISMGFKDDLEAVLSNTPKDQCNIWLFSATMGREVRKVADNHLRSPKQVQVNRSEVVPEAIEQIYYRAHEGDKPEIICKLIDAADDFYGLIFCQMKALVTDLTQFLKDRGFAADCLHGDMDQNGRDRAMRAFRDRKTKILVCTDIASRGLDVKDVTCVINYSIPRELDSYVHRIGRTARSGKGGVAISLVTPANRVLIERIEKMTRTKIKEGKLPTRKEIGAKKVSSILTKFKAETGFERALELMDATWKETLATMSNEEIAGRFLALSFPEVFAERAMAPEASRPSHHSAPSHHQAPPPRRTGAAPIIKTGKVARVASVPPMADQMIRIDTPFTQSAVHAGPRAKPRAVAPVASAIPPNGLASALPNGATPFRDKAKRFEKGGKKAKFSNADRPKNRWT